MQVQPLELGIASRRRAASPENYERRMQSRQRLDVKLIDFAEPGDACRRRRIIAGIVDSDDAPAGAGGKQELGDVRAQTHDSRKLRGCIGRAGRTPRHCKSRDRGTRNGTKTQWRRMCMMAWTIMGSLGKRGLNELFQHLDRLKSDSILGLMAKFRADTFSQKVDLGVGVYRDLSGNTPVLPSVRRAEQLILASQTTKILRGRGRPRGIQLRSGRTRSRRLPPGSPRAARAHVQRPADAEHCASAPSSFAPPLRPRRCT